MLLADLDLDVHYHDYERLTSFYQELQIFMKLKANLDFFPLQQYSINLDLR